MSHPLIDQLRDRLNSLDPLLLTIEDESHLHAGHAGAREGRHFQIDMVATAFTGLSPVARHRLVYSAAGDLMQNGIHALRINARAPGDV